MFLLKEEELFHIKELEEIMNGANGEEGKVILKDLDTYIRNILFIRFYIDMNDYIDRYGYLRVNSNAITHILKKLRDSDDAYASFIYQSLIKD